jgi:hypothetical protein
MHRSVLIFANVLLVATVPAVAQERPGFWLNGVSGTARSAATDAGAAKVD